MLGLDPAILIARAITLLIAFTIHELAHALSADYLGDYTPRSMGRITLNPLKHLDPFGTIMLLLSGFGWAKPVLVNPMNMRGNPRTSMALVALAGPVSNLLMASLAAIPFRLGLVDILGVISEPAIPFLPSWEFLLWEFLNINIILAVFNLIPIPPLDGYRILSAVLPPRIAYQIRPLEQYGFLLLMAIIFIPRFVPGAPNILGQILGTGSDLIRNLMLGF